MSKINNFVKIVKITQHLKSKPECIKQLYFPFTRSINCDCIDICKYNPPPSMSLEPINYHKIDDCISKIDSQYYEEKVA